MLQASILGSLFWALMNMTLQATLQGAHVLGFSASCRTTSAGWGSVLQFPVQSWSLWVLTQKHPSWSLKDSWPSDITWGDKHLLFWTAEIVTLPSLNHRVSVQLPSLWDVYESQISWLCLSQLVYRTSLKPGIAYSRELRAITWVSSGHTILNCMLCCPPPVNYYSAHCIYFLIT